MNVQALISEHTGFLWFAFSKQCLDKVLFVLAAPQSRLSMSQGWFIVLRSCSVCVSIVSEAVLFVYP